MQISVDGVPSPHKTKKAGRRRISAPPASRFSLDSKAFPLAKLKSPQSIVSSTEDFRGAGDRTRTGTLSPAADFESATSTNSITPAGCNRHYTR